MGTTSLIVRPSVGCYQYSTALQRAKGFYDRSMLQGYILPVYLWCKQQVGG